MQFTYPSILRRYFSTFIDGIFVITSVIISAYIFQFDNQLITGVRVAVVLILFFVYEPLFTSRFCTIGQYLTGIRVRSQSTGERLSIPRAYLRWFVKLTLGIISFFTIPVSKERRAIHDFAVGSIVIYAKLDSL